MEFSSCTPSRHDPISRWRFLLPIPILPIICWICRILARYTYEYLISKKDDTRSYRFVYYRKSMDDGTFLLPSYLSPVLNSRADYRIILLISRIYFQFQAIYCAGCQVQRVPTTYKLQPILGNSAANLKDINECT